MGLFGGTSTSTSNTTSDSGPSSWQKPYLDTSFNAATAAFNTQKGTPYYQGDTYAGMSDQAKSALDAMRGYASGQGLDTANALSSIGSNLAGYSQRAGSTIDDYLKFSQEDPTQSNMDAAAKYANNPYLDAQIDANARDVRRNLTEDILPGIDRAASAGGNINSSRAGIASGIAQRGAADRISDISAQLRSGAWNNGLQMAQQDRTQRLNAMGNAADAYGQLGTTGMNAMSQGVQAGYGAFDEMGKADQADQADRQGYLTQDFNKWQGEDQRVWDMLNRYNGIVGSNQWGSSGTSSTKQTTPNGGIFGKIIGGISSIAGIAKEAGAFSDPRLKKDVRKIGELEDGLGVYTFRYLWETDEVPHVGVMADEVERLRPHALGAPVLGFMTVNYEKL
jgi:hypothetical protein